MVGTVTALGERLGTRQPPDERMDAEAALAPVRAALGEEQWAAAFAAGQAMTLEEAIAEALSEDEDMPGIAGERGERT